VTGWKIDGAVNHLQPGVAPSFSQWRYDPAASGAGSPGRRPRADDPLDVLPAELTAPVRDAEASAWRECGRGWANGKYSANPLCGGGVGGRSRLIDNRRGQSGEVRMRL
jgi:hypothetical protein